VGEYSRSWLRGGTAKRARMIARLKEIGYLDVPGVLEPASPRL
jgi:hypothetical protein